MAIGLSSAEANAIVNGLDGTYFQLHVGEPGGAGSSNLAAETTRKLLSLNTASGGSATNDTSLSWVSVTGSETPTHFSLWSAVSGGTFKFSGTMSSDPYTAGSTFTLAVGDVSIEVGTVAA